jgi:hypothetical protein
MIDYIPEQLSPTSENHHSTLCDEVIARKRKAFPITRGNGQHYIDMNYLRPIIIEQQDLSKEGYKRGYAIRDEQKKSSK